MSALNTAERVIQWAIEAKFTNKPSGPPQGDAIHLDALLNPSDTSCRLLEQLIALTVAQLPLSDPPLDDPRSADADSLIIAAALGMCHVPVMTKMLLLAVGLPKCAFEEVARHALVQPALPFLPPDLKEEFKRHSPLTAALNYPVSGTEARIFGLIDQLLKHRTERQMLLLQFAKPTPDLRIRDWRYHILDVFRLGDKNQHKFVLDIYETQLIHYEQETFDQIQKATQIILNPSAFPDTQPNPEASGPTMDRYRFREDSPIRNALSIGQWWAPLHALDRAQRDELRGRRYLGYEYRRGIDLFNLCNKFKNQMKYG